MKMTVVGRLWRDGALVHCRWAWEMGPWRKAVWGLLLK